MPELPEVEVVRRGLAGHVLGRTVDEVEVHHPRAVRRHLAGADDFAARLAGRTVTAARRRGKYLWLDLDAAAEGDPAVLAHLGMSGQMLVAAPDRPDEKHLRIRVRFADSGPELRFVDQRTFGGLSLHPLVPATDGRAGRRAPAGAGPARAAPGASDAVPAARGASDAVPAARGATVPAAPVATGAGPGAVPAPAGAALLPEPVAHIARDPMDPAFDLDAAVAGIRRRRTELKRALLDQTVVSGIGNIYADEALWRARLHGARPTEALSRAQGRAVLEAAGEVMDAALAAGGTSFDALYVNVNGASGYFDRSLDAYGRTDRPCRRCGTPIRREAFMNRSSFSCPRCQPAPRTRRR